MIEQPMPPEALAALRDNPTCGELPIGEGCPLCWRPDKAATMAAAKHFL